MLHAHSHVIPYIQVCGKQSGELKEQQFLLRQREELIQASQESSRKMEADLKKERSSLRKKEGEVGALEVVREGLARDLDKSSAFTRKVAKALALDRATAEILVGDFAHDAIVMKAEQLAKLEVIRHLINREMGSDLGGEDNIFFLS